MAKYILVYFTLFFFIACSETDKENLELKFDKNMNFEHGYRSGYVQLEQIKGKEYLCFADFVTHKEIVMHPLGDGDEIKVDLASIIQQGEKIMGIEVLSEDTILVLTKPSKLFMLNHLGEIWRTIDFNPYLQQEGYYWLSRSSTPFQLNDTTLIFPLIYLMENLPLKDWNNMEKYYEERYAGPLLFKVDNIFKDTLDVHFGLEGFYNRFTDKRYAALEGVMGFTFFDDHIIFRSAYTDTLYKINPNTLEVVAAERVQSEYSTLGIQPITGIESMTKQGMLSENFSSNGMINRVMYDAEINRYFVIVKHKPQNKEDSSWSLIVLDENLKKLNEIKMDENKYAPSGMISKQGLLISNYFETQSDTDHFNKNTFALFRYE